MNCVLSQKRKKTYEIETNLYMEKKKADVY